MLGVLAIPSIIYTALVFGISESPGWLITNKNKQDAAKKIMLQIGVEDVEAEVATILQSNQHDASPGKASEFFNAKHKKIIFLAFLIAFFNQVSGINFILYYAPEILEKAGLAAKESLFNSIAIGGTNLIFTFVGLYLIDRLGRKTLLLIGSFGYIISLSLVSYAFYAHTGRFFNDFLIVIYCSTCSWTRRSYLGILFLRYFRIKSVQRANLLEQVFTGFLPRL
jgi:predicted MFS family arabinose efflux permease